MPNLKKITERQKKIIFIGFTGLPGAGKSALIENTDKACRGRNLVTHKISLSDELRRIVVAQGMKLERPILNKVANEQRKLLGNSAMAQVAFGRLLVDDFTKTTDVVFIDAIRTPEEIDWFRKVFPCGLFRMISVVADSSVIIERIQKRARSDESEGVVKSPIKAMKLLEDETGKNQPKFGLNISGAIEKSDLIFNNSGDISSLERFSEELLDTISVILRDNIANQAAPLSGYLYLKSNIDYRLKIASDYSESDLSISSSELRVLLNFETDARVRWHLIKAVGVSRYHNLSDILLAECKRENSEFENTSLHHIAAWSLGRLGKEVMPLVTTAILDCKDEDELIFLVDVLGELALPEGIDYLVSTFKKGGHNIRQIASLSMSKLGTISVEPLTLLLQKETTLKDRVVLMDALIKIGTNSSMASVNSLIQENEEEIVDRLLHQNNIILV